MNLKNSTKTKEKHQEMKTPRQDKDNVGSTSKRTTETGTYAKGSGKGFFEQFGVTVDPPSTNIKRSLTERSPVEEGTKKKQSLFGVTTTFGSGGAKRTTSNRNCLEQTRAAGKMFRAYVQKEEEQEKEAKLQEERRREAIKKNLEEKSKARHRAIYGEDDDLSQIDTEAKETQKNKGYKDGTEETSFNEESDDDDDQDKLIGAAPMDDEAKRNDGLVDTEDEGEHTQDHTSKVMVPEGYRSKGKGDMEEYEDTLRIKEKSHRDNREQLRSGQLMKTNSGNTSSTNSTIIDDDLKNQEEEVSQSGGKGNNKKGQQLAPKTPDCFKVVNNNSRNRRKSIWADSLNNSEKTPESNNRTTYVHQFNTRMTLKLTVKASEDPMAKVKETIQEFLKEITQIDDKLVILPWYENSKVPPLLPNSPMPTTMTGTQKLLHHLFVPKPGKDSILYPQVRLGHDIEFTTLPEELSTWTQTYGHGMFYNMLQAEDGTDIGWLLYSTREMDAGALADELSEIIGIQVGLRFKGINTGTKTAQSHNIVKALVVETSARQMWEVQRVLLKLYSRQINTPTEYPNRIRLRFVKMKKSGVNKVEKAKMDKLRQRQKEFLATVTSHTSHEIIQLDYSPEAGKKPTLRQMIMNLNSRTSGFPLFHCVDMDWKQEGFIFQFSSTLAEEAETTILTLLPTLQHFYPDCSVASNFTSQAMDRCKTMIWDAEKEMIVDTSMPEETEDIDDEENLLGFEFLAAVEESFQRAVPQIGPYDNDSVSTLHTMDNTVRATWKAQAKGSLPSHSASSNTSTLQAPPSSQDDSVSIFSAGTTVTVESFQALEGKLQDLATQMQEDKQRNSSQFNAIMQALSTITKEDGNDQSTSRKNNTNAGDARNSSGNRS